MRAANAKEDLLLSLRVEEEVLMNSRLCLIAKQLAEMPDLVEGSAQEDVNDLVFEVPLL